MSEAPSIPVRIGDTIAGKYRVERILGAGAMGVVVAGLHLDLHEHRAIKLMLPSALSDTEAVERFLREARAAARLRSDNVAKIFDVGRLDDGSPYIVMELLDGMDLKTVLDRELVLPLERAIQYVVQACDAIGEAHELGIVHRDLKPANLFLTKGPRGEERVKVLDFGIAKVSDPAGGGMEMTRTQAVLGTPLYMSPEQMRGAKNADARSDVWALGVILYRMLTGRVPFSGSSITEVCSAVISDIPEAPRAVRPDLPQGLEGIILRCLEKKPAARFSNASELATALLQIGAARQTSGYAQPVAVAPVSAAMSPMPPVMSAAMPVAPPMQPPSMLQAMPQPASQATMPSNAAAMQGAPVLQSGQQTKTFTPQSPSRAPWVVAVVLLLALGAAGIVAILRKGESQPSVSAAAPSAPPIIEQPKQAATPDAALLPSLPISASPDPSAAPITTATGAAAARPSATQKLAPAATNKTKSDAFGNDRK